MIATDTLSSPEVVTIALLRVKASLEQGALRPNIEDARETRKALDTLERAFKDTFQQVEPIRVDDARPGIVETYHPPSEPVGSDLMVRDSDMETPYFVEVKPPPSRPMVVTTWNRLSRALMSHVLEMHDASLVQLASQPTDDAVLVQMLIEMLLENPALSAREKAELRGAQVKKQWLDARGGSLSAHEVGDLIGAKRQTVNDKRARGEILGLSVGNRGYRYPTWQFADRKPLPGLKTVLRELGAAGYGEWSQLRFFLGENDYLKAHCPHTAIPIDALRAGHTERVREAAGAYLSQISF